MAQNNMIKLYNSLTKKNEEFIPLRDNVVSLYSCGPTVYDNLHIGNLSAFIYADTLRRMLEINDYNVNHVMNITDVDDKTITKSLGSYENEKPKQALKILTDKYTQIFKEDSTKTGIATEEITFISAVDTIPEMIALTQRLLDNKIAYIADDGVYFSITKYYQAGHNYGVLQKVATQQSKARISNDEYDKDSASDFALWKRAEAGEPCWDAVFSEDTIETAMPGRPGWHIECSAMSEKLLGLPFDIHTGGIDLKFPHHENEIAQSVAAGNESLAHVFFHNNHLLIDGKKMSKSLNNFYTLKDIEAKGFEPLAFRLLILSRHYSTEGNFTWEALNAAQNRLEELRAWADRRHQPTIKEMPKALDDLWRETLEGMRNKLNSNLDTPGALAVLSKLVNYMSTQEIPRLNGKNTGNALEQIDVMLGLQLDNRPDISIAQKNLLKKRQIARAEKDWRTSDNIRNELQTQGLIVRDESYGQVWSRRGVRNSN
jgi:cysteinyl-tRNA synthetase